MTLTGDEHPVGALAADGAHEPLDVAVRPRCPRRNLHHLDAIGGEHRVERTGELAIAVADQEPESRWKARASSLRAIAVVAMPRPRRRSFRVVGA